MGRLILLDRRGVGLSDRVGFVPSVEATAEDIGTVLDAAGSRRVVLFGASEGGPACIKFAADFPDRVAGLILFASLAKGSATPDYPHTLKAGQYDMLGESERARSKYDAARKLRSQVRSGAPDRCAVLRNRGPFTSDIVAYTAMLRMGPAKRRALTYITRGNAYLASGYPKLALLDYGFALRLRPDLHEVTALKAEAQAMLGRYPSALRAFDVALAARPMDAEIYSGRAVVHMLAVVFVLLALVHSVRNVSPALAGYAKAPVAGSNAGM